MTAYLHRLHRTSQILPGMAKLETCKATWKFELRSCGNHEEYGLFVLAGSASFDDSWHIFFHLSFKIWQEVSLSVLFSYLVPIFTLDMWSLCASPFLLFPRIRHGTAVARIPEAVPIPMWAIKFQSISTALTYSVSSHQHSLQLTRTLWNTGSFSAARVFSVGSISLSSLLLTAWLNELSDLVPESPADKSPARLANVEDDGFPAEAILPRPKVPPRPMLPPIWPLSMDWLPEVLCPLEGWVAYPSDQQNTVWTTLAWHILMNQNPHSRGGLHIAAYANP